MNSAGLFIDIGQSLFQALNGGEAFTFPIQRGENGRLTDPCRENLTLSLREFLSKQGRAAPRSAFCAIGANGVAMRRVSLPVTAKDEQQRMLRLQIENEFPVSPDLLAWGSRPIGAPKPAANGDPARQDWLVVAVKREVLEDYAGLLRACGVAPVFTLAALARAELHPPLAGSCAVLDIGCAHSELIAFDGGAPASIRILAWGSGNAAVSAPLGKGIKAALPSGKLYMTGEGARDARIAALLAGVLGGDISCEGLEQATGACPSAAIAGLMKSAGKDSARPPLVLELNGGQKAARATTPAFWKWAAAALLLVLGNFLFPYAEAIVLKPLLERKLAALQADRGRLATIDQELDFLKYLKQSQPPFLDTIYLLAKSAPQGARLDSLSMGRHQEISIRLKMPNAQQVSDFRSKLIESGWLANVVVEEQTPGNGGVTVRMSAELKPAEMRKALVTEPPRKRTEDFGTEPDFNPPEPMMMPPSQPSAPSRGAAPGPPPSGGQGAPRMPPRILRGVRINNDGTTTTIQSSTSEP